MSNKQPRKLFNFYFDTLITKVENDQPIPEFEQVNNLNQKPNAKQPKSKKSKKKIQKENQQSNFKAKSRFQLLLSKANNNEQILSSSEQREKRKKSKRKQKAVGNVRLNIFNILEKTNKGQEIKDDQLILSQPKDSDSQKQMDQMEENSQHSLMQKKKQNIKTEPTTYTKKLRNHDGKDKINLDEVHIDLIDEEERYYKNMRIRKAKVMQNSRADQTLAKKLQKIYNYKFQTENQVNQDYSHSKNSRKQPIVQKKKYNLAVPKVSINGKSQLLDTSLKLPAIDNKNKNLNKVNSNRIPKSIQLTPQKNTTIEYNRYNGKNVFQQSPPVSNKWNRSIMDIPANQRVSFSQNEDAAKRKADLLKESRMQYIKGGPTGLKNQFKNFKMQRISKSGMAPEQQS